MINPAEETLQCPYDRAHAILRSRMQFHLPRCRAQNPNMEKATCPFNSTHVFNYVEMDYHKEHCPDRFVVDSFIYKVGDQTPPIGLQPVKSFAAPESEEDWDSDKPAVSVLDQVREGVQHKGVLINKIGAPKSERKNHRFNERRRYQALISENPRLGEASQSNAESLINQADPEELNQVEDNQPPMHEPGPSSDTDNATGFPILGRKCENTELTEKMSAMNVGKKNPYADLEEETLPRPSAWGRPTARNSNEKISWPTAAPMAPANNVATSSARNTFPAPRPSAPRNTSNPWATNVSQQSREPGPSAHLAAAAAAPPRAVPSAGISTGANPANPAINGIWARGIAFNNTQARMTSEDFPTLLPITARGRKPRP